MANLPKFARLTGKNGYMHLLTKHRLARYYRYDRKDDCEKCYYTLLLLFMPFTNEGIDLNLVGQPTYDENGRVLTEGWTYESYADFFAAKEDELRHHIGLFEAFSDIISDAYEQLDEDKAAAIEEAVHATTDGDDLANSSNDDGDYDVYDLVDPGEGEFAYVDVMDGRVNEEEPDYVPFGVVEQPPQQYTDVSARLQAREEQLNKDQRAAFEVAKASINKYGECKRTGTNYTNPVQFISGNIMIRVNYAVM
jgi:hypothetical protein